MSDERLKQSITNRLEMLRSERESLKKEKELIDSVLDNDPEIQGLLEKMQEARREYSLAREQILNEPENRSVLQRIKDNRQEIKDLEFLLSGELISLFLDDQSTRFEDTNGNEYDIKLNAKAIQTNQQSLKFEREEDGI